MSDLPHTHAQQPLVHALHQPALAHQRVVGLLPVVAVRGSHKHKVSHTHKWTQKTHLDTAQTHTGCRFVPSLQVDSVLFHLDTVFSLTSTEKLRKSQQNVQNSPGVEGGPVQQRAVKVVTHKVCAHHGAFAVFGRPDGSGDDQVGLVPQIQEVDVEHQRGVWRNHITWKQKVTSLIHQLIITFTLNSPFLCNTNYI